MTTSKIKSELTLGMQATGKYVFPVIFIAALAISLLLSAGCSDDEQERAALRDSLKAARDSAEVLAAMDSVRTDFKGLYNYDFTGSTFRDCLNPDSLYLVNDESGLLKTEFEKVFPAKNVYGSVVVHVKGELVPTTESKFTDKYPTTLKVSNVMSAEKKNRSNTCVPYDYWAIGSDGNTILQISKKEGIIELEDMSEGKLYSFFWNEPRNDSGFTTYSSFNTVRKYSIDVTVLKETCKDPKTGEEF